MEIAVGAKPKSTQRGLVDSHVAEVIAPGVVLLAVAEGFGSIRGQAAPAVAATAVRDALRRRVRPDGRDARAALIAAFSGANARVFAQSGSDDDRVVSGTSLTAVLIAGERAHIAHVGRTRAYLGREGTLSALTADDEIDRHGWLVPRTGMPTEALAGHLLTRTLGTQPTLDATVGTVRLTRGDALVLTTGALHESVSTGEIAYALQAGESSEAIAQQLLQAAAGRGGRDGGTVIVGRALTDGTIPDEPERRGTNLRRVTAALIVFALLSLLATALMHAFVP